MDLEPSAAGRSICAHDRPAVALDDPLGDGESQARAARGRIGRPPESIEDPGQIHGPHAPAVVIDRQDRRTFGRFHRYLD